MTSSNEGRSARTGGRSNVGVPYGDGVLECYIDLLYRDDDGLVVVDYKTAAWSTEAELDAKVERYSVQLQAYADAVREAVGEVVAGGCCCSSVPPTLAPSTSTPHPYGLGEGSTEAVGTIDQVRNKWDKRLRSSKNISCGWRASKSSAGSTTKYPKYPLKLTAQRFRKPS